MKVLGIAIIAFCLSLASFVVLEIENQADAIGKVRSDAPVSDKKSIISDSLLSHIAEDHLDKPSEPERSALINPLPRPGAPLRLLALFQTYDQARASAVILHPDIGAYRYHVGEEIDRGRILAAILPDRILVKASGDIDVFYLEPLSVVVAEEDADNHEDAVTVPLSEAEQKKRNILKHFDLHPVSESLPSGYIIGDKFPEDATNRTGVKPGDILISVNGYPVGEDNSDYLAWLSFQTTQKASVVISRDGEEFVIYYPDDVMGMQGQGG